jgi:hypothetical protein
LPNFSNFFIPANVFLGVRMPRGCAGVSWEGGWDTGVGRDSYIYPNSRILIGNPLVKKASLKTSALSIHLN